MVQGKYIKYLLKIYILFISVFLQPNSYASAWLPRKGEYKFYASCLVADAETEALQEDRRDLLIDLLHERRKGVLNKEEREEAWRILEMDKAFSDVFATESGIEYGIANRHAAGFRVRYALQEHLHFSKDPDSPEEFSFKPKTVRGASLYYKYSLYTKGAWQVSLSPGIGYDRNSRHSKGFFGYLGAEVGHTKTFKSGKRGFSEIGFGISKTFNPEGKEAVLKKISFTEGVELIKDVILSNYFEYNFASNGNVMYTKTVYDQLALAREFTFTGRSEYKITAQAGYYWNRSLTSSQYRTSGPIFSVWLTV